MEKNQQAWDEHNEEQSRLFEAAGGNRLRDNRRRVSDFVHCPDGKDPVEIVNEYLDE